MKRGALVKLLAVVIALPFLGASCNRDEAAKWWQEQVAAKIQARFKSAQERALNVIDDTSRNVIKNLTEAQKKAIEDWLAKNKLNKYGDPKPTVYSGGTPLFNEQTGASANRYEFLFNKFPELKNIVQKP